MSMELSCRTVGRYKSLSDRKSFEIMGRFDTAAGIKGNHEVTAAGGSSYPLQNLSVQKRTDTSC